MSSLGDLKAPAAQENVVNTFYANELTVNTLNADELVVGAITVSGDVDVKGNTLLEGNLEVYGDGLFDSTLEANDATIQTLAITEILNPEVGTDTYVEGTIHYPYLGTATGPLVYNNNSTPVAGLVTSTPLDNQQVLLGTSVTTLPLPSTITAGSNITITSVPGSLTFASFLPAPTVTTTGLQIGGSSTGITFARNFLYYIPFGSIVFFSIDLLLTSKGSLSSSGGVTIALPITAGYAGSVALNNYTNITASVAGTGLNLTFVASATTGGLNNIVSNANIAVTGSQLADNSAFICSGFYLSNLA